ncbi:cation/H(+) antiporter 15 [Silene latifolia]|uniref:cation/H(+) antiporter 15 n=1 Tax=Silene latifolia TaxID=37657 RepID=UPI003D77AE1F
MSNTSNTEMGVNPIVCYAPTMITTLGIWQGDNPLDYSLPLFIVQLTLVVLVTRILVFLLKPLRQPRVIAEILGGVILGPSLLGRSEKFGKVIFPLRSVMLLETMANIGLLYFMFLVGVEMDIAVVKRTGRKAISIALGGMILPFVIGCTFSLVIQSEAGTHQGTFVLFLGVALAVTAFPVLARVLAELKLINTEMGRIAMSSALVSDICAWILLALAIALAETKSSSITSLWVILASTGFVVLCFFLVRPLIMWIVRRTPEGEPVSDYYICLILTGVVIAGFLTDAIGTHSVFGAFVFGLVIPNGPLGLALIEKLEDFVSGLLLPLFFAISGLKTDVRNVRGTNTWWNLMIVILLACIGKVAGTTAVACFYKMPLREGITLGLLMNTKGLVEMIILNVGKDEKVIDDSSFSIMVIAAVIMTSLIGPLVTTIYRPAKRFVSYKRRTIQSSKLDAELRVLVCVHTPRNVPTIINLLEASNATKRSPICVYVLHLVELTGRASAMLIVHNTRKSGRPAQNRTQAQSDHIINAFESYEENAAHVSVQPLTAISPYSSMHEDVCNLAEDKRVAFIIIPFHKQQTVDGGMENTNPAFRMVNQNILANSPCSVGILVDRGLTGSTLAPNRVSHNVAVLFFGGPDDREAIAYAWRMSDHSSTTVTVMRFIPGEDASRSIVDQTPEHDDPKVLTVMTDSEHERQQDEEYIKEFQMKTANNGSITYCERVVNNAEETVDAIRSIESVHDLYIVGRGQGMISPLTAGLTDWSECPELGAIGDMLASSDFAATVSVLVIQQYIGAGAQSEGLATPDSPTRQIDIGEQLNTELRQMSYRHNRGKSQDIF